MIAYMIMCHKNPEQVRRLASILNTEKSDVFIHCDKNMSDDDVKFIRGGGNSILTKKRFHGELDNRSLVDITLELIECAKENEQKENKKYQYFALLSGQDYAIQNIDAINEELHSHYPEPFIDCTPYDRNNWLFYKFNSNRNILKSVNYIKENMRRGIIRKVCRGSLLVIQKLIGVIHRTDYDLLRKKNIELYGGSAWWILPDKIIDFILDEKEKEYVQDLLSTWTPEETFFQIMAMRSPISNLVHINPPEQVSQSCKTWAYFSDEDKPFCGHPYIFTKTEFSKLVESECWFARKFDFCKDADIFDMLDNYYHN